MIETSNFAREKTEAISVRSRHELNHVAVGEPLPDQVLVIDQEGAVSDDVRERALVESPAAAPVHPSCDDRLATYSYLQQQLAVGTPLWVADMAACFIAIVIGLTVAQAFGHQANHLAAFVVVALAAHTACYWAFGLYPGIGWHPARELRQLFRATFCCSLAVVLGLGVSTTWDSPYVLGATIGFPLVLPMLPLFRGVAKSLMRAARMGVPFYFVGARADVMNVYCNMNRFGWNMLRPAGRFAELSERDSGWDSNAISDQEFEWRFEQTVKYRGTPDCMVANAKKEHVYWLFVVDHAQHESNELDPGLFGAFPNVVLARAASSRQSAGSSLINCGLSSGIRIEENLLLPWPRMLKRTLDMIVSGAALLALSPLFLMIALLIRITSPGPIFFSHPRIGRGGKEFHAWKFRSMVQNASQILVQHLERHPELRAEWDRDHKLKKDPRITWIGKIIRVTSMDELPQLWNVFVGEMSLVGPRPIVQDEILKYGNTFRDYLRVPPGITGLWQISGRNNTTYAERLMYDEYYVRHWSVWMDLYILIRTARTVSMCEGAY